MSHVYHRALVDLSRSNVTCLPQSTGKPVQVQCHMFTTEHWETCLGPMSHVYHRALGNLSRSKRSMSHVYHRALGDLSRSNVTCLPQSTGRPVQVQCHMFTTEHWETCPGPMSHVYHRALGDLSNVTCCCLHSQSNFNLERATEPDLQTVNT